MKPGTIIIINGTSSSGKTSIVRAFQNLSQEPYLDMGIDKFIWMLPKRYLDAPLWQQVYWYKYADDGKTILEIHSGLLGDQLFSGMHNAIHELVKSGLNIIADHVLLEKKWVTECAKLFHDLNAYLVGVRCPLDVVEERERARKDRTLGQAKAQFVATHKHCLYDLEMDTSSVSPEECAKQIIERVYNDEKPTAFSRLNGVQ
jgi:chloramphenicol 3-O phosphotransferase